ncbi:SWIM zinc finger family protein, partial [Paraburkholderia phenoliruptrix]|uniref:SWIM zinc finger family protein n=1 Tax=Paraburkholderia phenoliruptrix TaxID=252970 RepID=UPI001592565C
MAKARSYENAVSELQWQEDRGTLSAKVQGTRSRPYAVSITFREGDHDGDTWIDNECTCPVGYMCKHVAAGL